MRFLVDENVPRLVTRMLSEVGHDVVDVRDQMQGVPDSLVSDAAIAENRVLVTLDMDFANIVQYPPDKYPGIIVLRVPHPTQTRIVGTLKDFLMAVDEESIQHALIIVEPGLYRVRRSG